VSAPDQLILEFEHRPSLSGEDFLISDENREAVAWIDEWPNWPSPVIVIHGPPGCGKTHLCEVFRAKASAIGLAPGFSTASVPLEQTRAYVFDGLDRFMGEPVEEEIFHLYNRLRTENGHLLATSTAPPLQWPFATDDVRSRILASPSAAIASPGDGLIAGLLVKLFNDCQLAVGSDVVLYLVPRMERSFEAARRLVDALDRQSLTGKRRITIPLAREVLSEFQR